MKLTPGSCRVRGYSDFYELLNHNIYQYPASFQFTLSQIYHTIEPILNYIDSQLKSIL